jgi:hypothetical protein
MDARDCGTTCRNSVLFVPCRAVVVAVVPNQVIALSARHAPAV